MRGATALRGVLFRHRVFSSSPAKLSQGHVVMVNGIPGRMGMGLAQAVVGRWGDDALLPFGLTGSDPNIPKTVTFSESSAAVEMIPPSSREEGWERAKAYASEKNKSIVAIDFTHPDAALENVEFYARNEVPFVMGTTGGDRETMESVVNAHGGAYAVIAPNMGIPIVLFQAMVESAARNFSGALKGYRLEVVESHQKGKADTSGTARAVVDSMAGLGLVGAAEENIHMIRDPDSQVTEMGVPEEHLKHHAFHTYRIASEDDSVELVLEHNICGSAVYHEGTLDALAFLIEQKAAGNPKRLWSMVDILKHDAGK